MPIPSRQLINKQDYVRTGKNYRLLGALSIGPLPAPTKLHKNQSCVWRAGHSQCRLFFQQGKGWTLELPAGYIWDGSSAPGWVKKLFRIGRNSRQTLRGFLFHDAMYEGMRRQKIPPDWTDDRRSRARKWADKTMRAILRVDGYPRLKAKAVYLGVRVRGSSSSKPPHLRRKSKKNEDHDSPATEGRDIFPGERP